VKAKEVVVHGSIHGNVQSAEKIIIREKGSLMGDITTAGIVIEDGAYFKGSIDIVKAEPSRVSDVAQAPVAAPTQTQAKAQVPVMAGEKAS
jgi:cytoskeletal protein CcmA (bactofilin family)